MFNYDKGNYNCEVCQSQTFKSHAITTSCMPVRCYGPKHIFSHVNIPQVNTKKTI
jgi:hypothetical protein